MMRTRLLAPALALALLLGGCSARITAPAASKVAANAASDQSVKDAYTTSTIITYLPSRDGKQLIRGSQEMVVPDGQMQLQAAVVNLLSRTEDDEVSAVFGGGASLRSFTKSRDVLLIDISTTQPLEQMDEMVLLHSAAALVNTALANSDAEYVQLWINGQALASRGMLTRTMSQMSTNLEELGILHSYYLNAGTTYSDGQSPQALFYTDTGGNYLLASAQQVAVRSGNTLSDLIQALRTAPADTSNLISAIPSALTMSIDPRVDLLDTGDQLATVWFSSPKYENYSAQRLYNMAGAITMSIYCNYPDVDKVRIYLDNRLITAVPDTPLTGQNDLTADLFMASIADMVSLYFPHQQSGKLVNVRRAMEQSRYSQLRYRIEELLRGPLAGEDTSLTYAFPLSLTAADLLSVTLQGDKATVNFSSNFELYYPSDPAKERQMIYAVVNTLTEESSIRRVQFLVEDRRVGALGSIDLTNPLIRNPGLIYTKP